MTTYKLTLDVESEAAARALMAFLHHGPEHLRGTVLDAVMTGLLSKWLNAELTIPCLDGVRAEVQRDVAPSTVDVELSFAARRPGDRTPGSALHVAELVAVELGVEIERVLLAAARIGFAKMSPPARAPGRVPPAVRVDLGAIGLKGRV